MPSALYPVPIYSAAPPTNSKRSLDADEIQRAAQRTFARRLVFGAPSRATSLMFAVSWGAGAVRRLAARSEEP